MTDIVERLRAAARLFEEHGDLQSLPHEAADAIERLRTENERLRDEIKGLKPPR